MVKILSLVIILTLTSISAGCKENDDDPSNPIIGLWTLEEVQTDTVDVVLNFRKTKKFESLKSGYRFMVNGTMTSYQLAGWCATPPVSFEESPGDWTLDENKLNLKVKYWGGLMDRKYQIVKLDKNSLQLKELD